MLNILHLIFLVLNLVPISFILNVLHGFFSLIYYGSVMVFGVIVAPRLSKLSNETVNDLMHTLCPTLVSFIEATGMITIVFGAGEFIHYLIGYDREGGISEVYHVLFSTGWGICIFSGAILGFIGFSMGLLIGHYFERLFKLFKSIDPESIDEITILQNKLKYYSTFGAIFLTMAVILMILGVSFLPLPA